MCNLLVTALIIAFLLIMSENVELNPELRSWVQLDSIVLCTHPNARFGALVDDLRGETEGLVTDFQIHSHYGVLPLKAYRNVIPTYSGFVDACVTFMGAPQRRRYIPSLNATSMPCCLDLKYTQLVVLERGTTLKVTRTCLNSTCLLPVFIL